MNTKEIKEKLLSTNMFIDNKYLDKYCELMYNNLGTIQEKFKTQKHHIIPIYYFKEKLGIKNREEVLSIVDKGNESEIVNLLKIDHILAHYYLEMCSTTNYKAKNIFSIYKLVGGNGELLIEILKGNIKNNQLLNDILNSLSSYTFSDLHKQHLKDATKTRNSYNGKVSKSGYVGGVSGLKMIYDVEGKRHYVEPSLVESYLAQGWSLPTNKKKGEVSNNTSQKHTYRRLKSQEEVHENLSKSHLGNVPSNKGIPLSEEAREKIRNQIQGRKWLNNGIVQKQVKKEDIDDLLKQGFVFGQLKRGGDK